MLAHMSNSVIIMRLPVPSNCSVEHAPLRDSLLKSCHTEVSLRPLEKVSCAHPQAECNDADLPAQSVRAAFPQDSGDALA